MIEYFRSNPCHISSIILSLAIPYTIYTNNHIMLLTEIPICITTLLLHHDFKVKNIRKIDIIVGQIAYWHHIIIARNNNNNASINYYLLCPFLYLLSNYFKINKKLYLTNLFHSFIHYSLFLATLSLNYKKNLSI